MWIFGAIENAWEGTAAVFDGPEDYHHRINDPDLPIDGGSMLFIRYCGPVGYPGFQCRHCSGHAGL